MSYIYSIIKNKNTYYILFYSIVIHINCCIDIVAL